MFWTISNMLSIARMVLVVPMAYTLWHGYTEWTLALFALAVVTDLLDGYVARKLNQISDWGKILDPVADKVFVATVALLLVVRGDIPLWFLASILVRDALILAGGIYAQRKTGVVLPSNYVGKVAVIVICIAGTLGFVGLTDARNIAMLAAMALMIASLGVYGKRWYQVVFHPSKTVS